MFGLAARTKAGPLEGDWAGFGGPIPGFGGGTFNIDGTPATPAIPTPMTPPSGLFAGSVRRRPSEIEAAARNGTWSTADVLHAGLGSPDSEPTLPDSSNLPNGWIARRARQADVQRDPQPDNAMQRPLGGSMRQPFDYAAELQKLLPPERKLSTLQKIAMIAGPALMGMAGNQAGANQFLANMQARRQRDEQRRYEIGKTLADWKHQDWARQNGADLDAAAPFTIGRDRLSYNPATGKMESLYHGPADWESYASTLGLEPGSQAYMDAAKDYVLRSNGPTAYANDIGLDDHRTGNRLKVENVRQGNRVSLEGVRQHNRIATRQTPTYHDTHPTPRGSKAGGGRPRATNGQGQTVEYDGKAWVPVH